MKHLFSKITAACFAVALLALSVFPAFADDTTAAAKGGDSKQLSINGQAGIDVGKTVTYTLYLSDTTEPIVGFEMRLFYDKDFLEYQKSSLKFEKFEPVIYNEDIAGKIPMNYSALTNMPDFSKKGQFVSANFKVLKGGEANISYFFTELYGENMTYLKDFTFTYDLTEGKNAIVKDAVPPVNDDADTLQNNQGDFKNFADGKGENNTPNKQNHEEIAGESKTLSPLYQEEVVEVTRTVEGSGEKKGGFPIFIIIAIPVVIAAVVVAIVLVNKKSKSGAAAEEEAPAEEAPAEEAPAEEAPAEEAPAEEAPAEEAPAEEAPAEEAPAEEIAPEAVEEAPEAEMPEE